MLTKVSFAGFAILMSLLLIVSGVLAADYTQAPEFEEAVVSGDLPTVEQRLPAEPVVLDLGTGTAAVEDFEFTVGEYGGTFNFALIGMADFAGAERMMTGDTFVRMDPRMEIGPNIARDWEISDDYTTFTFYLVEDIKWSDGEEFTSEDVSFYFNNFIKNQKLTPGVPDAWKAGGEVVSVTAPDKYTVKFEFAAPKPLFMGHLATHWNKIWHPTHYAKKYHKDFADKEILDGMVEEEGFDSWSSLYLEKMEYYQPERPVIQAYKAAEQTSSLIKFKRNPYYWKVDKEGKQLPYIDEFEFDIIQSSEVAQMKAVSGELTAQVRQMNNDYMSVYYQNQDKGNYSIGKNYSVHSTNLMAIKLNLAHPDPAKRELLMNDQFRKALSIAINRQEILDLSFSGMGEPAQNVPDTTSPVYVEEYVKQYTEYDPGKANEMLDEIGITERDDQGFRLGPDGENLTFTIHLIANNRWSDPAVLLKDYWADVGIRLRVKEVERSLMLQSAENAENDMYTWWGARGNLRPLYRPQMILPTDGGSRFACGYGKWYRTNGEQGMKPPEDSDMMRLLELWDEYYAAKTEKEIIEVIQEAADIHGKNLYDIGVSRRPAGPAIISNNLRNRPHVTYATPFTVYSHLYPEQWWLVE